ncbi:MAG TPA: hypothetical protein VKV21_14025 [Solirubrobacteraceae bacterium]|nr:hypothetical protein [Solirubrobacteraceae bacterium]
MSRRTTKSTPSATTAATAPAQPEPEQNEERITITGRLCAKPVLRQAKSGVAI